MTMADTHYGLPARLDDTALVIRVQPSRGRRFGVPALLVLPKLLTLAGPVLLAAGAVVVHLLPGVISLLEYSRDAILGGQLWRIITGHWTHASLDHLVWDVLAFAALGGAVAWRDRGLFWWTVLGSAVAISLTLFVFAPQWETYRGLSGIDSALFVALGAAVWMESKRRSDRWLAGTALLLFSGKVSFEMLTGSALFTTDVAGHEVVPMAHFVGACVGVAAAWGRRRASPPAETVR